MENSLKSLILQSIPAIELVQELQNTRGAATWKIKQGSSHHVLKASKIKLEEEPKTYNHAFRVYTLEREAKILQELEKYNDKRYSFSGKNEELVWVASKWIDGKSVGQLSKAIRANYPDNRKKKILSLIISIFEKTAGLHKKGYLHGDLQPAHFMINDKNKVFLLDYGLSKSIGEKTSYKGAFVYFNAPTVCDKIRSGAKNIEYIKAYEIYSMASVAFLLYTGKTSTDFGADSKSLTYKDYLRLIAENGASNSFKNTNAPPFPELEEVLNWCLASDIEKRCPSLALAVEKLKEIKITA